MVVIDGSSEQANHAPRGILVLGMHRSGTSVVSGILSLLGLNGGPREQMFEADAFNSDGYWELRPLVELNDRFLRRRRGFASAPPGADHRESTLSDDEQADIARLLALMPEPWFMKDPRQCLVLPEWNAAIGTSDPAILVFRRPHDVIRSLRHRNGYSESLAAGLWETYTRSLLLNIADRPCHIVQYDELLNDALGVTGAIASMLERTGVVSGIGDRVEAASSLVRPPVEASSSSGTRATTTISREQRQLAEFVEGLNGPSTHLTVNELPAASGVGDSEMKWRQRKLRLASLVVPSSPTLHAWLDRRAGVRFSN